MKKLVYALALVVSIGTLAAHEADGCDMKAKGKAKSVELTGTVVCTGSGDDCEPVFRVANSDTKYKVCHGSKVDAKTLTTTKDTYKVTGKITSCGDDGEVLVIEKASKI